MIVQLLCGNHNALLPYCTAGVPIILLQNGVYSAHMLVAQYPETSFYALEQDYLASGIAPCTSVTLISASEWVELCARHHPVVTIQ